MSVVRFLELMGSSADLRRAPKPVLYAALQEHGIDAKALWAMLRGDDDALRGLLLARSLSICAMFACDADVEVGAAEQVRRAVNENQVT